MSGQWVFMRTGYCFRADCGLKHGCVDVESVLSPARFSKREFHELGTDSVMRKTEKRYRWKSYAIDVHVVGSFSSPC